MRREDVEKCPICNCGCKLINKRRVYRSGSVCRALLLILWEFYLSRGVDVTEEERYKVAYYLRKHKSVFESRGEVIKINCDRWKEIVSLPFPEDPIEKAHSLLLNVNEVFSLGERITINGNSDYILGACSNKKEFLRLVDLLVEMNYLKQDKAGLAGITASGYRKISDLKLSKLASNQAFVAMSFNKENETLQRAFVDGIEKALSDTGYKAYRVIVLMRMSRLQT